MIPILPGVILESKYHKGLISHFLHIGDNKRNLEIFILKMKGVKSRIPPWGIVNTPIIPGVNLTTRIQGKLVKQYLKLGNKIYEV